MNEFSLITYKGKKIHYIDYSNFGSAKEKTMKLIAYSVAECKKLEPKSSLTLINVKSLSFDMDIINAFKDSIGESQPFVRKLAVAGLTGLQKVVYNFITNLSQKYVIKAFDTEQEAKEWLISETE
jgi:hypothetical protein